MERPRRFEKSDGPRSFGPRRPFGGRSRFGAGPGRGFQKRDEEGQSREFGAEDRPRRSFQREGGYRPREGFESRPPREGGFERRPPREGGFDRRPPREGGYERRPPREGGYQPRGEGFRGRPREDSGYERRPPREGGFDRRPPREGGYERRPRFEGGDRSFRKPYEGRDDRPFRKPYGDRGDRPFQRPRFEPEEERFEKPFHPADQEGGGEDFAITGKNAVLESLDAGTPINKVLIRKTLKFDDTLGKIADLCRQKGIRYDMASDFEVKRYGSRDVVALTSPIQYAEVEDIIAKAGEESIVVVLDGIEDPQNLGAIIRSAECFGADGVVIPKHGASSVTGTVIKTSSGAASRVKVARVSNLKQAIEALKAAGFWVYGASASSKTKLGEVEFSKRCAIVIGSEGEGLRKTVEENCDTVVSIPMVGKISSLNASVAGGIIMFETRKSMSIIPSLENEVEIERKIEEVEDLGGIEAEETD